MEVEQNLCSQGEEKRAEKEYTVFEQAVINLGGQKPKTPQEFITSRFLSCNNSYMTFKFQEGEEKENGINGLLVGDLENYIQEVIKLQEEKA